MAKRIILGKVIHTKSLNEFEVFPDGFVAIQNGKIIGVGDNYASWKKTCNDINDFEEHQLSSSQFLMPGFVDTHIHAPQVPQIGLGLDKPLMEWLETYTFPLEANYKDKEFAQNVYEKVVKTTIKCGTTLASYFATNHRESTIVLAKEILRQGQRALVGKVCSDQNSPDFYRETCDESLEETTKFVGDILNLKSDLVKPTITPRFAISCSQRLMNGLGDIAAKHNLNIQSHISENLSEIDFAKSLYGVKSYASIYDDCKLLSNKCIMAHGVHLEDEEIQLFKKYGVSVAHCPASNTFLSSGLCDVKRILCGGVKVGLGTDVSGGNSPSIQRTILHTLEVSQHVGFVRNQEIKGTGKISTNSSQTPYTPLNYKEAIYLATLGGAEALALGDKAGNFLVGKEFDALVIDLDEEPTKYLQLPMELMKGKSEENKLLEMVQKFIYVGDDRNIIKVFVNGKEIK